MLNKFFWEVWVLVVFCMIIFIFWWLCCRCCILVLLKCCLIWIVRLVLLNFRCCVWGFNCRKILGWLCFKLFLILLMFCIFIKEVFKFLLVCCKLCRFLLSNLILKLLSIFFVLVKVSLVIFFSFLICFFNVCMMFNVFKFGWLWLVIGFNLA